MKAAAQEYINQNIVVIPLSKKGDGKGTKIKDWQNLKFGVERFGSENNIGMNLKLSKKGEGDMDSKESVYFAPKFMSTTRTLGLKSPTGSMTITTHYVYDEIVEKNITRTFPDGTTIAELRGNGNLVVAPSKAKSNFLATNGVREFGLMTKDLKKILSY